MGLHLILRKTRLEFLVEFEAFYANWSLKYEGCPGFKLTSEEAKFKKQVRSTCLQT